MTIYNLFYCDNWIRTFSSKAKAMDFVELCCDDHSLDISDYWISKSSLDDMEI